MRIGNNYYLHVLNYEFFRGTALEGRLKANVVVRPDLLGVCRVPGVVHRVRVIAVEQLVDGLLLVHGALLRRPIAVLL